MQVSDTFTATLVFSLVTATGCVELYAPPEQKSDIARLVVDGVTITPAGEATLALSRTQPLLVDTLAFESGARVSVESENGDVFNFNETVGGHYSMTVWPGTPGSKFRLRIRTSGGVQYSSDFEPYLETPPIDTLFYEVYDGSVDFYVNAHNTAQQPGYYLWTSDQTWSYHARYRSFYKFENGQIVRRDVSDDIYHCWATAPAATVVLASTERLSENRIYRTKVASAPLSSSRFLDRFSLHVSQSSLTAGGFEFWQQMKKNTEELGTFFGPLPSAIRSNIHNNSNPDEPVAGFFGLTTVQQRRIFIVYEELPPANHETGYETCEEEKLYYGQVPYFSGASAVVDQFDAGYLITETYCADCRLRGGSITKPDFW